MRLWVLIAVFVAAAAAAATKDLEDLALQLSKPLKVAFQMLDSAGASMDCLQTISVPTANAQSAQHLLGFYHSLVPNTNNWNIYAAESTSGPFGPWKRIQTMVSSTGSMPFIHFDPTTGFYILCYESMASSGNFPKLLFYSSYSDLVGAKSVYGTTLMKRIHTAASPNTYSTDADSNIQNVGTPTITSASFVDNVWQLYMRFHFTTKASPEYDSPGYGLVSFNPSKEVNGVYFNWQAFFDNDANNAIEVARSVKGGKIGQRANIHFRGLQYYLYEAQLTSSFDWKNWRLFLYSIAEGRAVQLQLSLAGVVDFANPALYQIGNTTVVTLFIPSEGITSTVDPSAKSGCAVYTLPALL